MIDKELLFFAVVGRVMTPNDVYPTFEKPFTKEWYTPDGTTVFDVWNGGTTVLRTVRPKANITFVTVDLTNIQSLYGDVK